MKEKEFYNTFKEHAGSLEGTELKIYFDNVGVPTIGVGYTFIDKMGKKWKAKSMVVLLDNSVEITQKLQKKCAKQRMSHLKQDMNCVHLIWKKAQGYLSVS